ncbi:hypothetical protein Terro_2507 [Terriglobus roseus DSM 18391]|uniref:Uncharacterized protein n=1 Tax=Terriglobus roseus (strain DSM 18391 / NRRL B-41598 / KBS 63) TaxID=926566 RepID=I3ZHN6_TERRK|nr:hypothetical protein [Terriglobus roseus]AFL88413.1 hypothetical protein Terro_2143 [Terriglobus roseus DSM 18391]AFL88754.1 hypothetical protein Terro_2507 [Terriglobus roseus DSM 18391]
MSADYLELLLGRARGELPAAEPRILPSMAPPSSLQWEEINEERLAAPDPHIATQRAPDPTTASAIETREFRDGHTPLRDAKQAPTVSAPGPSPKPFPGQLLPPSDVVLSNVDKSASMAVTPLPSHENVTPTREAVNPISRLATADPGVTRPDPPKMVPPTLGPARPQSAHPLMPPREQAATPQTRHLPSPLNTPRPEPVAAAPITIRIDRIEVRTSAPTSTQRVAQPERSPAAMPLEDYLRRKGAGR